LRAYTVTAARASFEEGLKGRLAPGFLADAAILDRDLFRLPPEELLTARVTCTIVGGRVVHRA
jgi:predicted amidohydrolase YtcJ